jgi:phosphate transport system protein
MPRETFDQELDRLQDAVLILASMVEQAISESVDVLRRQDLEGAKQLIIADRDINQKRNAIENDALLLVATQQPVAGDLRYIASVLEIAAELERMGDYAKGIAKITLMIGDEALIKPLVDIPRMAHRVREMIHKSLDAFVNKDVALAKAVPTEDDEVDALYNQVYRELLTIMMSNPRTIDQASALLWAAHNLERTADRVTNICERVIFTVTGERVEMGDEADGLAGGIEELN